MSRRTNPDAATAMKSRMRADLTAAMKAGRTAEVRLLRMLVAALDNAEAVLVGEIHQRYVVLAFADRSAEAPRLILAEEDVRALLERERSQREDAAAEFDRLGRPDNAERLRAEAAVVGRYLD